MTEGKYTRRGLVDGRHRIDRDSRDPATSNLDLIGVWVHSPEKDGKDAGELANGEPIGLAASADADALIALKPDCVDLCRQRTRARCAGDPRLRQAAQRRNQRGDDEHHPTGQPAYL